MKLKKASAWVYNKSRRNISVSDLNIFLRPGETVDLFKAKPDLSYEQFLLSKNKGVLYSKRDTVVLLDGPPVKNKKIKTGRELSKKPIANRSKSAYGIDHSKPDYISMLEEEFPTDSMPENEQELWELERQKMLEKLNKSEVGEEGEVFDDWILDEEPDLD